jgi:O-antigen/teichoic acid export membrane protein
MSKISSVKSNAIANSIGQIYTILIAIIITPFYLKYLGAEAYGLVTFFALLQSWMNLLDLGLSPTIARQAAYARAQKNGFLFFKRLLKSFELIFIFLALLIVMVIFFASEWIAFAWIKANSISADTLIYCISLMGLMIGMRWFASLYRSGIVGMEDQVWLSAVNIVIISLKFIGAFILLAFFSQSIQHFFEYQLVIGFIEMLILLIRFYSKLKVTEGDTYLIKFDWQAVKSVAPFTLGIAYTAGLWVLITQIDKLILSGILNLNEFGYFGLVALLVGGITSLSYPISQAIMPRMTLLIEQGKINEMLVLYRQSSQVVTVISLSISLIVGLYAYELIFAWTGDTEAANWGSDIMIWFALGNGILGISTFQYYLQNAFGRLRLHVIGSTVSAIIQVPIIFFAAVNYGAEGAGIAWLGFRLFWFLAWTPVVHSTFLPGFHFGWLLKDILPIAIFTVAIALCLKYIFPIDLIESRTLVFLKLASLGCFLLAGSSLSSRSLRKSFYYNLKIYTGIK